MHPLTAQTQPERTLTSTGSRRTGRPVCHALPLQGPAPRSLPTCRRAAEGLHGISGTQVITYTGKPRTIFPSSSW